MATDNIPSKINRRERLEKQLEAIRNRLQAVKAREKTSERKRDIRRKILLGAYYLEQATKNNSIEEINNFMDHFLQRDIDRELFGLPPSTKHGERSEASGLGARRRRASKGVAVSFGPKTLHAVESLWEMCANAFCFV